MKRHHPQTPLIEQSYGNRRGGTHGEAVMCLGPQELSQLDQRSTVQMNYHVEVLREKVSRLRAEVAEIQRLNNQHQLHRGNDPTAQVAHIKRQERLQAIQRQLVQLAALGPKVHSIEEMNDKHHYRLHLVKKAS